LPVWFAITIDFVPLVIKDRRAISTLLPFNSEPLFEIEAGAEDLLDVIETSSNNTRGSSSISWCIPKLGW
tara:strand:- start:9687 stop:9896 length:210 start_codon:yes stop_codon:yes gene_type:complete